ncbi:MAG: biotin transporter BioY [bacterium]|jgi:biotin transport system substrate-specific component|nr:MAG: biotin transporter BioY [bacterium]
MTIAGTLVAGARGATALRRATAEVVLVTAGAALVALGARLSVPLPFSQVPITGQTFAVLLVGAALGSGRGVASMLTYLAAAVAGLPIFSGGGCCLPWLLGPTGGYLMAFPFSAWLVGRLAERGWDRRFDTAALAMLAGTAVIYAFGVTWLAAFVGWERALLAGFLPFLVGDAVKLLLAAALLPVAWKIIAAVRGVEPGA